MKIPRFETERLLLREYLPADLDRFLEMLSNREVIRYLIHTEPWPQAKVESWLSSCQARWDDDGFGFWILELKEEGVPIGWCGLNKLKETDEVEVLYALDKPFWGQGLASEAASFSVRYGLTALGLEEIIGLTIPENIASARVLEKAGLTFVGKARYFDHDLLKYFVRNYG
jgi:ribosomal-protein-alanine N-acetyltransferase